LALEGAGALAAARGRSELAVRLWAAADADRRRSGFVNMPADQRLLEQWRAQSQARLGEDAWTAAWRSGERLTYAAAIAEAQAA
jgi:hypothetical protein